jgi:hypothetical protein
MVYPERKDMEKYPLMRRYPIGAKVMSRNDYIRVKIEEDGDVKWEAESRRTWELQRGPLQDGDRVFHIDGDRTNNRIGNLARVHFNDKKFTFLKESKVLYLPKILRPQIRELVRR